MPCPWAKCFSSGKNTDQCETSKYQATNRKVVDKQPPTIRLGKFRVLTTLFLMPWFWWKGARYSWVITVVAFLHCMSVSAKVCLEQQGWEKVVAEKIKLFEELSKLKVPDTAILSKYWIASEMHSAGVFEIILFQTSGCTEGTNTSQLCALVLANYKASCEDGHACCTIIYERKWSGSELSGCCSCPEAGLNNASHSTSLSSGCFCWTLSRQFRGSDTE